jgi:hypothetical protein
MQDWKRSPCASSDGSTRPYGVIVARCGPQGAEHQTG